MYVIPYIDTWIETQRKQPLIKILGVVSFTGTWIETIFRKVPFLQPLVVSFTGTWVEICKSSTAWPILSSYLI